MDVYAIYPIIRFFLFAIKKSQKCTCEKPSIIIVYLVQFKSIMPIIDYQCNGSGIKGNVFRQACNRKDMNYGHMLQLTKTGSLTERMSFTSRFYARMQLPDNSKELRTKNNTKNAIKMPKKLNRT